MEAVASPARRWKSTHTSKAGWGHDMVRVLASALVEDLPSAAVQLLTSGAFKGGPLVRLGSLVRDPSIADVRANHVWLRPFCKKFSDRVPSSFLVADILLEADSMLGYELLKPDPTASANKEFPD
eukprot:14245946-Alexandrium_andersonii.AAC.1